MAVKKNKKRKSVLWLRQWTTGRTPSHLQSHTAAVYIATRSAWVLWGSKHWAESADSVCCLCGCSRFAIIASPSMHRAMHSLCRNGQRWYQFLRAPMLCLMCPTTTAPLHYHSVAVDLSQLPENSCWHPQQVLPANNYSVPLDRYILIVEVVC